MPLSPRLKSEKNPSTVFAVRSTARILALTVVRRVVPASELLTDALI
jgi:hypothetical protein